MKTVFAPRASAILFNLLADRNNKEPFLLPANICPIVPLTFFKAGIPFEFVDISPRTLHMDLDQVEARFLLANSRFGGLLYTHTYGDQSTPYDFFTMIKKRFPATLIIDDRCLCSPELEPRGKSNADVILFSTGYSKIVDLGYGGFAFLQEKIPYESHELNYHRADLEALQNNYERCIAAREQYSYSDSDWLEMGSSLPTWPDYARRVREYRESSLAHRQLINALYTKLIPRELCLGEDYQTWRFNIRVRNKEKILAEIFKAQLFASSHYASLSGIMSTNAAPCAQHLADHIINLFNDQHYTQDMAERTVQIILGSL